jgi:hypothetical protein
MRVLGLLVVLRGSPSSKTLVLNLENIFLLNSLGQSSFQLLYVYLPLGSWLLGQPMQHDGTLPAS